MSDLPAEKRPTIGIVGLGLIGGSIGLALRIPYRTILGCDLSSTAESTALSRQCVDRIASLEELADCEVVFIGAPPGAVIEIAKRIRSLAAPETVVTDCSSVKSEISAWAAKEKFTQFVPGHPMAGHEKSGCEYSSSWMFRNARWILTPNPNTSRTAVKSVEALVKEMGATPVRLDSADHDRHVALLSHLPHVLAAALVLKAEGLETLEVGAGSWKDLTRVGGVDPTLWSQIMDENREELGKVIDSFGLELEKVRRMLGSSDKSGLEEWLKDAQVAKARQLKGTGNSVSRGKPIARRRR